MAVLVSLLLLVGNVESLAQAGTPFEDVTNDDHGKWITVTITLDSSDSGMAARSKSVSSVIAVSLPH